MQIEILGYLVIPLGLILMFLNRKWLLYATVFFMGFTGASILTVNGELSIQPAYYFAILFILKQAIYIIKQKKIIKPNMLLLIFIVICIISLIMPLLVHNKEIYVINQDNKKTNIEFTVQNITQLLYIIFCFIFYWITKDYLANEPENTNKIIKILIWGAVVVVILGIYQEIAYIKKWEFDRIFRSGIHGNIQTYGNFVRIYSTAIEPSMLAYYLAPIIALMLCLKDNFVKHKYIILFIMLLVGIGTISTTFFLGIFSFAIIIIMEIILKRNEEFTNRNIKIMKKILMTFIIGMFALVIVYFLEKSVVETLFTSTIGKITKENLSGIERNASFMQHCKIGLQYPLLGVGFGTARSKDLFSTWLCNIGVIGITVFITYVLNIILKLKKIDSHITFGIANYIALIFICAFASVSEPYNLFIWIGFVIGEVLIKSNIETKILKE